MSSRATSGYAVPIYKALILALVVLVSVPVYFSDYRAAAFNIFPRDDYSPYLLAMTGETGDGPNRQAELFPSAPMAHRPLSVAAALPFYYVLPYYAFTNIEAPDEPYLRATAALAFRRLDLHAPDRARDLRDCAPKIRNAPAGHRCWLRWRRCSCSIFLT